MINSTVFAISSASATALKEVTGKRILPAGNSSLAILSNMSYVGTVSTNPEITYGDILQAATQDTVDGPSAHTAAMYATIEPLIPMVSSHISFIRNTVLPKCETFMTAIENTVSSIDSRNPLGSFNVVQVSAPTPVFNEDLMHLVERFADSNTVINTRINNLPELSNSDIAKAMEVSSASVNESIRTWIAQRGENWLTSIWSYYFNNNMQSRSSAFRFDGGFEGIRAQPAFQRMDTSLALFLIARGLMDSPPEDVNASLSDWRDMMNKVSRFAGAQAMHAFRMLNTESMKNSLILSVSDDNYRITVNSVQYDAFLERGGSIDIIVGAALSGRSNSYSVQQVEEGASEFKNIWTSYKASTASSMTAQSTLLLRAEALAAFSQCLQPCNEDEAELLLNTKRSPDSMLAEARNVVNNMTLKDLRNARDLATCLIAGIRFSHTPAKQFINEVHAAQEAGCECPREAAAQAAIGYLCDWIACNLALGD